MRVGGRQSKRGEGAKNVVVAPQKARDRGETLHALAVSPACCARAHERHALLYHVVCEAEDVCDCREDCRVDLTFHLSLSISRSALTRYGAGV